MVPEKMEVEIRLFCQRIVDVDLFHLMAACEAQNKKPRKMQESPKRENTRVSSNVKGCTCALSS